jgi:hypothetical protein
MGDTNEELTSVRKSAAMQPQQTVLGLDVDGKEVNKHDLGYKTSVVLTCLFPFLAFRRPESRVFRFNIFPVGGIAGYIAKKLSTKAVLKGADGIVHKYVATALSFMSLMLGTILLVFYIVYTCFSFNQADASPTVGSEFQWVMLVRAFLVIAVTQSICLGLCHPNRDRLKMLSMDMSEFDKDLSYIGVMHNFRKLTAWIMRKPFKMRWFTTFMSDSILLVVTFVFSIAFRIAYMIEHPEVGVILHHSVAAYRSLLTCGFIVYTLEFAPRVDEADRGPYFAGVIVLIATQVSDFFLFVSEKSTVSNLVVRWIASIGQLYITHAAALLAVIQSGHHFHTRLSPDLTWKGFLKLFVIVILLGGLWTTYSVLRYMYSYDFDGVYNNNWIPMSYAYVYWPLSVAGGIFFCVLGFKYLTEPRSKPMYLVSLHTKEAVFSNQQTNEVGHDDVGGSVGGESPKEDISKSFDFDISLIMITFVVACLYYTSNFYASAAGNHWTTMAYYLTVPMAPIGLGTFALTRWIKPPRNARWPMYSAIALTYMLLISVMSFEDCEISADVPLCCEYPWLPDGNHELEEAHEKPSCYGVLNQSEQCLTFMATLDEPDEVTGSQYIIPLGFSAVSGSTRGVQVDGYIFNTTSGSFGEQVYSALNTDIDSMLHVESCQPEEFTLYTSNSSSVYGPGCYGQYLYKIWGEDAQKCDPEDGVTCVFVLRTLNCAFVKSEEALEFVTVSANNIDITQLVDAHVTSPPDRDIPSSSFFSFFRIVGLAGLLECFFCIFGIILKIAFLTECRTERAEHAMHMHPPSMVRKPTVIYSAKSE